MNENLPTLQNDEVCDAAEYWIGTTLDALGLPVLGIRAFINGNAFVTPISILHVDRITAALSIIGLESEASDDVFPTIWFRWDRREGVE